MLEQAQQTQSLCITMITFVQLWSSVEDVGTMLYKCYTNVFVFADGGGGMVSFAHGSSHHMSLI